MTSPLERWPELAWFFEVLHQDFDADYADRDACLLAAAAEAETSSLRAALSEWHDAFDEAGDADFTTIVGAINPWWDADRLFGGYREWAQWVREHLERELAKRPRG